MEPPTATETATASTPRLLLLGVGGATCSGKTTLAKHLSKAASKDVMIVHQDDFAPKEEDLPWNDAINARDWDTPYGSIDYARMSAVLSHLRQAGTLPESHSSHDHLNILPDVPLSDSFRAEWQARFRRALLPTCSSCETPARPASAPTPAAQSQQLRICIVDGFLLYFDPSVRRQLDVRFFLRARRATLQRRRTERSGYNTAEGTLWQDPPGYFDKAVWPAYVEAHRHLFAGGDVEHGAPAATALEEGQCEGQDDGQPGGTFPGLVVLDGGDKREDNADGGKSMRTMVMVACEHVERELFARARPPHASPPA
ncbi:P-loop containing nucleoside triphosphate hydrolase protein [Tilletiaria anomala UBC 951]|uniref:p-loop containing nucleoside triphosphate hydrolase protein n=1 Tax=Tilletiaria anomala (strain ATCC 24038 / CBS 436.72 / UBC 951) TaxID=1037660 RepID=A0A066W8G8_TILAU|nr:P-loop containing nucleoside triphosphate hydrolase protein [Tilletiaria anomala UBC 951]KDN47334.1 P-loop containing nucleoside triphosphate hydrolase protein [Tilletiaria anomala UBC 951]